MTLQVPLTVFAAAAGMLLWTVPAFGHDHPFTAVLSGAGQSPSNGSPAVGFASGEYDTHSNIFHFEVEAHGFMGLLTGGSIHVGGPGSAGPATLALSSALGSTEWFSHDVFLLTEEQEMELMTGNLYVNIRSEAFPDGEIRGQIVPAPGALAAAGLMGLAVLRRRR